MEKLTSSNIEWQEDDVCALIDSKTNELLVSYGYTRQKFDVNSHYIVTREAEPVKTVFDAVCVAVNDNCGVWPFELTGAGFVGSQRVTREEFNKCVDDLALYANSPTPTEPMYYHIYKIAFADMQRQKEEQTSEEVLHGLFDKSRSPWVNLAALCSQIAKEHPVEAFADSEPQARGGFLKDAQQSCKEAVSIAIDNAIQQQSKSPLMHSDLKPEVGTFTFKNKPIYTKTMKDAGELPSVGMECVIAIPHDDCESVITYIGDKVGCAINKSTGHEFNFTCVTGDFIFQPIDTRTPEQKQVDEVIAFLSGDNGWLAKSQASCCAEDMQKAGLLRELK